MSLLVHVAREGVRVPISGDRTVAVVAGVLRAEKVKSAMVSVTFVTNAAIAALNRKHLNHRGATDVISFGLTSLPGGTPVVGDIYIAPAVARANAKRLHLPVRLEIARLVVHGTLHVLGHTHPDAESRELSPMWRRQELLLRRVFPLPNSL